MRELISEIWQTAQRNKLRTGLTGFAVAWGIFMLIVLLGAGNGLVNAQLRQSSNFLTSSMVVFGGQTSKPYQGLDQGREIRLKDYDMTTTRHDFPDNIDEVGARIYQWGVIISLGQQYVSAPLAGVWPNHASIDKKEIVYGRFVNDIDVRDKRKVVVLSNKQVDELLGAGNGSTWATGSAASSHDSSGSGKYRGEELIGRYVKVGSLAFKVVGIYKDSENGQSEAYTAYTTLKTVYGKGDDAGRIEFSFHGLPTEQANADFEKRYRARLNANHTVHPEDESAIYLWNRFTQSMQMQTGIGIIRMALWIVGLFTLLSGVVGVSNIMLITVKERTHEFGIRKAIGAKPWNILRLIIAESVIITTFFGYIGMVLGVAANEYMDATLGHEEIDTGLFKATMFVDPTVGLDVCFEATMVMVLAGTIAGLIPAFKASRIRPIEALRAD